MSLKFRLINRDVRLRACEAVRDAPDGSEVTIREQTRTLEQNALLWPLLYDLSRQVDWRVNGIKQKLAPEDWKDLATAALKKEQRVADGFDGGCVFLGSRTSRMTKREFSDLIEIIRAFGSEHGVVFTDPPAKGLVA